MEVEYVPYEDKYYKDLQRITLGSFELTSFNTDSRISPEKARKVAWNLWCRPVLESDKNKYCIVALIKHNVVGYIIYGADAEYSKLLNIKIGSIILLVVDKKFQGQFHIAAHLLKYVLDIYVKYQIKVITSGTDLDNLPALINYINAGFRPILFWTTYRFYFNNKIIKDPDITVNEIKKIKKNDLKNFSQPVSFFMDNRFDKKSRKKLDSFIRKKILSDIKKETLQLFEVTHKNKDKALFTFMKEEKLSEILEKDIYRINDIIFFQKGTNDNKKIINGFLYYLKKQYEGISIVETFIKSNDWELIETLLKSNFIPVHNAVTLHKFL